jgi:hypothetical protein
MVDGFLATLDPESVAAERPSRLVTAPRAVFGFHLLIAVVFVGFAGLLVTQGTHVSAAIVTSIAGMVVIAGWAAGRVVARR